MKKTTLDQELESAVDATESVTADAQTTQGAPKGSRTASYGLLAILLCMGAGIALLVLFGFKEAAVYALPVSELKARSAELQGRRVRVDGELVPGSLKKQDDPCEYRFTIQASGASLDVRYPQCVVPDTFRDRPEGGVKVTVTGALQQKGDFEATEILAKCASKYDPKTQTITKPDGTKVKATPEEMLNAEQ
ncbi:MAG: cytochrome c maturation protein CcmE [Polyangiaceae bacterium]